MWIISQGVRNVWPTTKPTTKNKSGGTDNSGARDHKRQVSNKLKEPEEQLMSLFSWPIPDDDGTELFALIKKLNVAENKI